MTLNILISTIDSGIKKIPDILLPYREDVKYIVSHQYRDEKYLQIPNELMRDDVLVSQIPGQGLTKSRNNAIRLATGDICVIADDDVRYTNVYLDKILHIYENNQIDVACFKIDTGIGNPNYKKYPDAEVMINSIYTHNPSSIEITFLLKVILEKEILFDQRFGIGSSLAGGEESLFIYDAVSKDTIVKFFPYYIVKHPFESTIKTFSKYHQRRVRVVGAVDARKNGYISILKAFVGTLKLLPDLLKHKKNPFIYFYERFSGSIYILKSNKK